MPSFILSIIPLASRRHIRWKVRQFIIPLRFTATVGLQLQSLYWPVRQMLICSNNSESKWMEILPCQLSVRINGIFFHSYKLPQRLN